MQKVKTFIKYPDDLDLSKFVPDSHYELYSVLIHEGFSLNSGHYYSYVKANSKWYCMNDSSVLSTNESTVLRQNPYILFYKKKKSNFKNFNDKIININSDNHYVNGLDKIDENGKPERKSSITSINSYKNLINLNGFTNHNKEQIVNKSNNIADLSLTLNEVGSENIAQKEEINVKITNIIENKIKKPFIKIQHIKNKVDKMIPNKKLTIVNDNKIISATKNEKHNHLNQPTSLIFNGKNISNWDDSDDDKLEKQKEFISKSADFMKPKINYKDKYDIEYDKGKLKKVKEKKIKEKERNQFQRFQKKFYSEKK